VLHQTSVFFVNRAKSNMNAHWVYSQATDRVTGIVCDQFIALGGRSCRSDLPQASSAHLLKGCRYR